MMDKEEEEEEAGWRDNTDANGIHYTIVEQNTAAAAAKEIN